MVLRNGTLDERLAVTRTCPSAVALDIEVPTAPLLRIIELARGDADEVSAALSIDKGGGTLRVGATGKIGAAGDELDVVVREQAGDLHPWQWNLRQLQLVLASLEPLKQSVRVRVNLNEQVSQLSTAMTYGDAGREALVAVDQLISIRVERWTEVRDGDGAVAYAKQERELRSDGAVTDVGSLVPLGLVASGNAAPYRNLLVMKHVIAGRAWDGLPEHVRAKFRVGQRFSVEGDEFVPIEASRD